jgi:hypothetical protein
VTAQTVTISDATAGATIYYTTDGTTPTTSSTLFTGAITVSSTETLEAIATATGYSASAAATATYTITPPTAAPLFNVNGRTVTISDATAGATIYYTTDGTTPTTSSTLFTGAITVSSTETLEAIATAPGYSTSSVSAITVTVSGSAFELSASPASLTIAQGGFGTSAITVTGQSGLTFNPAGIASLTSSVAMTGQEKGGTKVALTAFGLPLGVSAWFTPNPTTEASLLTLVASRSVVPGTYKLTITATSHLEHRKRHDRQWPHRESCDAYTATTVIALTVSAAPGNGHSHR